MERRKSTDLRRVINKNYSNFRSLCNKMAIINTYFDKEQFKKEELEIMCQYIKMLIQNYRTTIAMRQKA